MSLPSQQRHSGVPESRTPPFDDLLAAEVLRHVPPGFMRREPAKKLAFLTRLLADLVRAADAETRVNAGRRAGLAPAGLSVAIGLNAREGGAFAPGSGIGRDAGRPIVDAVVAAGVGVLSRGYQVWQPTDDGGRRVVERRSSRLYPGPRLRGVTAPPSDRPRDDDGLPDDLRAYVAWVNGGPVGPTPDGPTSLGPVGPTPDGPTSLGPVGPTPQTSEAAGRAGGAYTVRVCSREGSAGQPRVTWDGQPLPIKPHRANGRRFYAAYMNRPSAERLERIRIGGRRVVEVDYSCQHLTIIYRSLGLCLEGDAYDLGLCPELRPIIKRVTNAMICARSVQGAVTGVRNDLRAQGVTEADLGVSLTALAARIAARHAPIRAAFGRGLGPLLQLVDSEVMRAVLNACRAADIVALPVHDAVIVPEDRERETAEIMRRAFASVTGGRCGTKVKRGERHDERW